MKNSQQNPIDELFREELGSYTIPVVATATTVLATAAIKKGLLYKLSIFKLNVFYSAAIVTTTVGGVSVGAVKTYQYIKEKSVVESTTDINNSNQSQLKSETTLVIDSLEQTAENIEENQRQDKSFKTEDIPTQSLVQSKTNLSEQKIGLESMVSAKTEVETRTENTTANTSNAGPTVLDETAKTDSIIPKTQYVKKVVYVKPQQVVVQDTVVKVVKKGKKK